MIKVDGTDDLWFTLYCNVTQEIWNSTLDFTNAHIINSVSENLSDPTWVCIGDHNSIREGLCD